MEIKDLVIDTNAFSDYIKSDQVLTEIILNASKILFPIIVLAELKSGYRLGNRYSENMDRLNKFIALNKLEIVYPNFETADFYTNIFKELRLKGKPIPTNDIWIAALVIQNASPLLTKDKHFRFIDGLELIPIPKS